LYKILSTEPKGIALFLTRHKNKGLESAKLKFYPSNNYRSPTSPLPLMLFCTV